MIPGVILSIIKIYLVLDPIGLIPYYLALTRDMDDEKRWGILNRAFVIVVALIVVFAIAGRYLLEMLGFTMNSFKIAGGILLFLLSVEMMSTIPRSRDISREDIAVFPIATPLLVGPGTLTMILILLTEQGPLMVCIAALAAVGLAYMTLLFASRVLNTLRGSGLQALSRLMAVLLATYAVEMVMSGIRGWMG